jgi:hypothetical protein
LRGNDKISMKNSSSDVSICGYNQNPYEEIQPSKGKSFKAVISQNNQLTVSDFKSSAGIGRMMKSSDEHAASDL